MAGTRSALIVAAYDFQDEKFQELRAPARDAEALAGVLGDDEIGGFEVKTLINQPCDVVTQELEAFCSDRTPEDLLLLYFSCHGIKDSTGRLYFAMANTRFQRLRSTGVSASFVSEQMEYSRSRRIALLLDCCYSGAFLKGLRARASEDVQVKDHFEGRGRAVITASRATEYAFEGDELSLGQAQPSLFTNAIVQGLATGQADRDGDGLVTVDELYDYVYDEVRGKVAGQTPGRWVDVEGELVVARNPHPPVVAAELPPEMRNAVHSESAPHRIGAVTLLAGWLERGSPAEVVTAGHELTRLAEDPDVRVKQAATEVLARRAAVPEAPVDRPPPAPPAETAVLPETASPAPESRGAVEWVTSFPTAVVLGAALLLTAIFTPFTDGGGALVSEPLDAVSLAVVVAVALTAAALLRGPGDRRFGLALLVGVMPAIVLYPIAATAFVIEDSLEVATGMVLLYAGCALLLFAGVRALVRLRRSVALLDRPTGADVALAFVSGLLGVGAALALGADVEAVTYGSPFTTLAWRLTLAFGGLLALRYWSVGARLLPPRVAPPVVAVLSLAAVALFLASYDLSKPYENIMLAFGVVVALASAAIPLVSALMVPRRVGATVLATWAATQGTLVIRRPSLWVPYVGALAVAVVLWRRTADEDAVGAGPDDVAAGPRATPGSLS